MKGYLLLLGLLWTNTLFAYLEYDSRYYPEVSTPKELRSSAYADRVIEDKIGKALAKYPDISYHAEGGMVTLTGAVRYNEDRSYIERKVRSIPDVRDIYNQIDVIGP